MCQSHVCILYSFIYIIYMYVYIFVYICKYIKMYINIYTCTHIHDIVLFPFVKEKSSEDKK